MAVDQYMFASPIKVNSVSTPSAAKARASMSEAFSLLIVSYSPLLKSDSNQDRNARHRIRLPLISLTAARGEGRTGATSKRCGNRVGARLYGGVGRVMSRADHARYIARELCEQNARDVDATGVGEGFQRPRDREASIDIQNSRGDSRCGHDAGGQHARGATLVDTASLDGAAMSGMIIDQACLTPENRNRRSDLTVYCPAKGHPIAPALTKRRECTRRRVPDRSAAATLHPAAMGFP